MNKKYYIYIVTNEHNSVLYTGVTNDIVRRVYEHKEKIVKGFTGKYNVNKLVYYEILDDPVSAIEREKQIKSGSRRRKVELIKSINKGWKDLYYDLV